MIVLALLEPALLNSEVISRIKLYKGSHCHVSGPHKPQKGMYPKSFESDVVELTLGIGGFSWGNPTTGLTMR